MKKILITVAMGLVLSFAAKAQASFELTQDNGNISVTGTSTLHDWEVVADNFTGFANVTITDGELEAITNLTLIVEVASLKSGKSLMDSKTREAFNDKKNPRIVFELKEIVKTENGTVSAKGLLAMAGVSKEIQVDGTYEIDSNGNLLLAGTKNLKMTEFSMKPPTAVMGTIKTGDEVVVAFSVMLKKNNELTTL